MRPVATLWLLFVAVTGQEADALPPIWPGQAYKPGADGIRVFLTPSKDALIVNDRRRDDAAQPYLEVPLLNQANPSVIVQLSMDANGMFEYLYTVANGPSAGNAIGTFAIVGYPGDDRLEMWHRHPEQNEEKRWRGLPPSRYYLIARQVSLPGTPPGAYLRWFHHAYYDLIEPGESMTGFWMRSSFRPGFTTGFVASGRQWELDPDWGEEIFSHLGFLNRTEWKEQPLLTFGPRYGYAVPPAVIAKEFLVGIERWCESGNLDARSVFVQSLVNRLRALSEGSRTNIGSLIPATVEYESELSQAVRLSLGEKR